MHATCSAVLWGSPQLGSCFSRELCRFGKLHVVWVGTATPHVWFGVDTGAVEGSAVEQLHGGGGGV